MKDVQGRPNPRKQSGIGSQEIMQERIEEESIALYTANRLVIASWRERLITEAGNASDLLKKHFTQAEEVCARILDTHSPLYWLLCYRSLPYCSPSDNLELYKQKSEMLDFFTALTVKHGNNYHHDVLIERTGALSRDVTPEDFHQLNTLLQFFEEMMKTKRLYESALRGSRLLIDEEKELTVTTDDETDAALALWYSRSKQWTAALGFKGLPLDVLDSPDFIDIDHPLVWLTFSSLQDALHNWMIYHCNLSFSPKQDHDNDGPFIPFTSVLPKWAETFLKLESASNGAALLSRWTLHVYDLLLCFSVWNELISNAAKGQYGVLCQHNLCNSGLLIMAKDDFHLAFLSLLSEEYPTVPKPEADKFLEHFLQYLEFDQVSSRGCNLLGPSMQGCLMEQGGFYIVDATRLVTHLKESIRNAPKAAWKGHVGTAKGLYFENVLAERITQRCKRAIFLIKPGKKLELNNESSNTREIDLYIQVNNILILVNCKAMSTKKPMHFYSPDSLNNRWAGGGQIQHQIDENDKRARLIASYPREGKNYEIPPTITHLLPVICTLHAEYVPPKTAPEYFLQENLPRVLTPGELIQLINTMNTQEYVNQPFMIPLPDAPVQVTSMDEFSSRTIRLILKNKY